VDFQLQRVDVHGRQGKVYESGLLVLCVFYATIFALLFAIAVHLSAVSPDARHHLDGSGAAALRAVQRAILHVDQAAVATAVSPASG
jgi:hypothetical protein